MTDDEAFAYLRAKELTGWTKDQLALIEAFQAGYAQCQEVAELLKSKSPVDSKQLLNRLIKEEELRNDG